MPIEYAVDDERRQILVRETEPVELADVIQLLDRQAADGRWNYSSLTDLRGISWIPTAQDMRRAVDSLAMLSRQHGRRGPVAFVATEPAMFGMFRMYATLAEAVPARIEVFRNVDTAKAWLNCVQDPGQ
jgi:hypothetical protein